MYVVERVARGHRYLYLVESVREGKTVRQRTIKALGRKDVLAASGELDRLAASIARHAERSVILSDIDAGRIVARRIGGPLLFGRLWQRLGVDAVLEEVLEGRQFGFAVERAVFVATLHRLFVSGSDRACLDWMESYAIEGSEDLALHHFYRAMAWLGEEIEGKAEGALAPRCVKDVIEEKLFDRRRDLFTDLSLVFMDTTSLSFYGAGGDVLGRRGHSKDHRPELGQLILAVVIDAQGRPICTEMVPGNTADVTVLMPIVTRLRTRFGITRSCVVADRGMISADTIVALPHRQCNRIILIASCKVLPGTDDSVTIALLPTRGPPDELCDDAYCPCRASERRPTPIRCCDKQREAPNIGRVCCGYRLPREIGHPRSERPLRARAPSNRQAPDALRRSGARRPDCVVGGVRPHMRQAA